MKGENRFNQKSSAVRRSRQGAGLSRPFPFVTLKEALQKALSSPTMRRRMATLPIGQAWSELVGETVAEHVQPVALDKGVLTLAADSSVWRQQISFEKKELLEKIAARFKEEQIKEIRVK